MANLSIRTGVVRLTSTMFTRALGRLDYTAAPVKGAIVGSYRILGTLSVGGMGTVYRAEHTLIGRLAAVKILHPEMCAKRDIVNRFFNEARATSSIKHPGIVEVFDFGYMPSGHAYLVMEFLEGMPLSRRIRTRGPIPEGEAALLLRSVCIALSAAHDKGIVHRDLKPDNVFVLRDPDSAFGERIKILDFGIAKLTDGGGQPASATKTGAVMGTPTYMSPEQCRGRGGVDFRADLYSIGCMFYELVAGRPPFASTGAGEQIGSHLFVDPEPPSRHVAGLSPETEALIMTLLAKQPEDRVQSAKELAHRLALIAQQHGWLALGEVGLPSFPHITLPPSAPAAVAPAGPSISNPTPEGPTPIVATEQLVTTVTPPRGQPAAPPAANDPPPANDAPLTDPPSPATDAPTDARTSTTLSGSASQVDEPGRRSRRSLGIAVAGGLLAAACGIAAIIVFGSEPGVPHAASAASPALAPPSTAPTPAPVAQPDVVEPAHAAPPAGRDPSPAQREPTDPSAPPPAAAPAPAAPALTEPPAIPTDRREDSASAAPRAAGPEVEPARPPVAGSQGSVPGAAATAPANLVRPKPPAGKPAAKPVRKPVKRPDKAGSGSETQDLLEQDI
jgi:serine/threonine protein kinase